MNAYKPTKGPPEVAIILSPSLYRYGQFIGTQIVAPIQKEVPDFGSKLISVSAFQLENGKKPTKKQLQPHIMETLAFCDTQGIETIICTSAPYFEAFTKQKFMKSLGTVKQCTIEGYEHLTIIPMMSPATLQQYPGKRKIVQKGIRATIRYLNGNYSDITVSLKTYRLLKTPKEIKDKLEELKKYPMIAWDIETTGLNFYSDEVITHAFAINEEEAWTIVEHKKYTQDDHEIIKELMREFFHTYKGKLLIHNVGFESKFYAFKYFMSRWDDYPSMYKAINEMNFEDTMLLAKAARNSVDREDFGLKDLAAEKFGDWDADIDVKKAIDEPLDKLAYYNAIDVCATWYVWNTINKEITPEQKHFYDNEMKDVQRLFSKIMLTGLPIDYDKAQSVKSQLEKHLKEVEKVFYSNPIVREAEENYKMSLVIKYNSSHIKQKTIDDFQSVKLNYGSPKQKSLLLFEVMEYEPIEYSEKTKEPKADKATIQEYLAVEEDDTKKEVLECLLSFSEISIILSNFVHTFLHKSIQVEPNVYRLFGNLVNAGAISYRPTANKPLSKGLHKGNLMSKTI